MGNSDIRELLAGSELEFHRVDPAQELRGSLVSTSLAVARELGEEERYFAALDPAHHEAIRQVLPQSWVPMEHVVAHYRAMNDVFPVTERQIENGRIVAARTVNTYAKTVLRSLRVAGQANPAGLLGRIARLTALTARGGGAARAYSTGPKDARAELTGFPILAVRYARNGWRGMFEGTLGLATRRVFVREDPSLASDHSIAFVISWV